ncbi:MULTISPECIES: DUF6265 family protein [unclassified Lentimicrobium]|uniref:DUF6265 family protein n=1 Tax=unclassified Lentimicrobium TaxID=2677434 RepID=UPI0015551E2A|nr:MULTISPECIES: DUF6265 family protein [unclassified Lentimicrobium]NPD44124.1 hypothetical protein [Lentimicrobium sp. S6]NPD86711.1 hypothetical protein [Lentimicrobium sp. L6]
MKKSIFVIGILFIAFSSTLMSQSEFPNTTFLEDGETSPKANLEVVKWLAGHWQGEAFGGITEELWTPPKGNSMMGSFKLLVDEQVSFYEIMVITEEEESLILRLKHFHGDLKGWEEKDETHDFKLVKVTPNKVFFEGFTLERISKDEINIYVVIEDAGKQQEMKFPYQRVQ